MIAWFMRRRCLWCSRSAIGMCWSHNISVNRQIVRVERIALRVIVVAGLLALNGVAWRFAGRRWLP